MGSRGRGGVRIRGSWAVDVKGGGGSKSDHGMEGHVCQTSIIVDQNPLKGPIIILIIQNIKIRTVHKPQLSFQITGKDQVCRF